MKSVTNLFRRELLSVVVNKITYVEQKETFVTKLTIIVIILHRLDENVNKLSLLDESVNNFFGQKYQ